MNEYLSLFLNNLLPIFLAAGAGYFLAKWLPIQAKTLSSIAFYIFGPCLVFSILTQSGLGNGDLLQVMLVGILCVVGVGAIAWICGRALRLQRSALAAFLISAMFMNAGNYGMPVTLFAFGENALAFSSVFFVTNLLLVNTLGVFIASLGRANLSQAAANLLKLPALYGLILAVIFMMTGWNVPLPLERTTKLLGDASIPTLMVLLGVQFHTIKLKGNLAPLAAGSAIRLLASPALMLGISALFGLHGAIRQAVILEAAMPSAVINTVLATQYDADPPYVAGVVAATTLLSPLTLTPLLAFLGA